MAQEATQPTTGAAGAAAAALLGAYLNTTVCVVTADGRCVVGLLRGFDQVANVVLAEAVERVFTPDAAVEEVPLGLYVIKGDNVAVVGSVDKVKDASIDWSEVRGEQIRPVVH